MNPPDAVGGAKPLGPYDPVFLHARREAVFIFLLFFVCLIWSVSVCYLDGYGVPPEGDYPTVLGFPRWVFWGIFLPWIFADVVTIGFCLFVMKDDDLGEAHEGEDIREQLDAEDQDGGGSHV